MHDFTTFEHTIPVHGDSDPMRKHMKKFRCTACNKDKFHIPLKTVDGRTVCIHCCMTGKGQDIVLDKRTVDALEAVANRINGTDNYPSKEKLDWNKVYKEVKKDALKTSEKYESKKELASFFTTAAGILFFWVWFIFFR